MSNATLRRALAGMLLLGSCSKPAVPRDQAKQSVTPAPAPAATAAPTCPGEQDPPSVHVQPTVPPSFSLKMNAAKLEQVVSRAGAAEGWRVIASSDGLGPGPSAPFVNGWQRQRELRSIVSVDCSASRTDETVYAGSAVYLGKECNLFAVVQPGNGKCPGVPKESETLLRAILAQKI